MNGWPDKMFYRSAREAVSSRSPLPSQSETHVLPVPKVRPNPNTGEFRHTTDEDRALKGTRYTEEVQLAVDKEYSILEIYEVYEHKVT